MTRQSSPILAFLLLPSFACTVAVPTSADPCSQAAAHVASCTGEAVTSEEVCAAGAAERLLARSCDDLTSGDKGDGDQTWREYLGWDVRREVTCAAPAGTTLSFITTNIEGEQLTMLGEVLCESLVKLETARSWIDGARNGNALDRSMIELWFGRDQVELSGIDLDAIQTAVDAIIAGMRGPDMAFSNMEPRWRGSLFSDPCDDHTVYVHAPATQRIGICQQAWTRNLERMWWHRGIIHELAHRFAGAEDHGYQGPCGYWDGTLHNGWMELMTLEPAQLIENAETYASWITDIPFAVADLGGQDTCRSRRRTD